MRKIITILITFIALAASAWAQTQPSTVKCIRVDDANGKEFFSCLLNISSNKADLLGISVDGGWVLADKDGVVRIHSSNGEDMVIRNVSQFFPKSIIDGKIGTVCLQASPAKDILVHWFLWGDGTFGVGTMEHPEAVDQGTWDYVRLPVPVSSGLNGVYKSPTGLLDLTINGDSFTMGMNGRDLGAGTVKRDGNQLSLYDGKAFTIWTINSDGSLSTNTYGLAGTWRKVQ